MTHKPASQLTRVHLKGTMVTGVAAPAESPKPTPRFDPAAIRSEIFQGGEITLAAQTTDTDLIQPLLDEYSADTGVTINTAPAPYGDLYTQLNIALTQASGAYDVVSLDDPWMPQFAGGQFLMNIQELLDARGETLDADFIPEIMVLGDYPAGTGLRGIPWVGNVQVLAWRTDVLEEMGAAVPYNLDTVCHACHANHRRAECGRTVRHRFARRLPATRARRVSCRCCAGLESTSST